MEKILAAVVSVLRAVSMYPKAANKILLALALVCGTFVAKALAGS